MQGDAFPAQSLSVLTTVLFITLLATRIPSSLVRLLTLTPPDLLSAQLPARLLAKHLFFFFFFYEQGRNKQIELIQRFLNFSGPLDQMFICS